MTTEEILEAVRAWQTSGAHPLTCAVNRHRPLEPVVEGGEVVLRCLDCDYRQRTIPHDLIRAGQRILRRSARSGVLRRQSTTESRLSADDSAARTRTPDEPS